MSEDISSCRNSRAGGRWGYYWHLVGRGKECCYIHATMYRTDPPGPGIIPPTIQ